MRYTTTLGPCGSRYRNLLWHAVGWTKRSTPIPRVDSVVTHMLSYPKSHSWFWVVWGPVLVAVDSRMGDDFYHLRLCWYLARISHLWNVPWMLLSIFPKRYPLIPSIRLIVFWAHSPLHWELSAQGYRGHARPRRRAMRYWRDFLSEIHDTLVRKT